MPLNASAVVSFISKLGTGGWVPVKTSVAADDATGCDTCHERGSFKFLIQSYKALWGLTRVGFC